MPILIVRFSARQQAAAAISSPDIDQGFESAKRMKV